MFLSHFLWIRALVLLKSLGTYQDSQVVANKSKGKAFAGSVQGTTSRGSAQQSF